MIRFALYGCGVISGTHARALVDVEGAELIACADLNPASAETFAEKHQIQALPDWNALLQNPDIDAVCICTPSGTHAPLAIEALNAGKHVVLEKPMGLTVAQCDDIIAAAEKSNKHITVISQLRTEPDIIRAKELIESGALGKIIMAQLHMCYYRPESYFMGSWRGTKAMDGGGALMNQGIHGVDLLLYLAGDVKSVYAVSKTLVRDIEVEDTLSAVLEFQSGATGVIQATTSVYPGYPRRLDLNGDKGSITLEEGSVVKWDIQNNTKQDIVLQPTMFSSAATPTAISVDNHRKQFADVIRALKTGTKPLIDIYEGRRPVDLILAIYKSAEEHRVIDL